MSETKNELETLLEQAATEPAHRPAFFRTLLESTVWVPGTAAEGEQVVEDSALDLLHWEKDDGTSVIPFFTSLEALQEAVEDEQAFVVMPVRTLFEMTLGQTLFLNAKLPTGKEFTPREISHLIGDEGNPLSTQEVLDWAVRGVLFYCRMVSGRWLWKYPRTKAQADETRAQVEET